MSIKINNKANFCFLRNKNLCKSRKEAIDGLKANIDSTSDGSIILARYKSRGSVRTIMGVVYSIGDEKQITIFEGTQNIISPSKKLHYEELYK